MVYTHERNALIDYTVDKQGNVKDIHLDSTTSPALSQGALQAVSFWKYEPFLFDGEPVEVKMHVTLLRSRR